MAHNGFCACNVQRCGALTVTFSNDSVPRGKRPLQDFPDGEQPLQLDAKRPCWERLHGSPPHSQKTPQPSLHSSPSSRAASQAYALTSNRYWDDSDLDASLLEPSDGEEPDSPWGLSPEAEAKLLEDDPGEDDADPFPPFGVFGMDAKTVENSCAATAPEVAQPSSISSSVSNLLEKTVCGKPLPLPNPSDLCTGGLACRNGSAASEHGGYIHRDSWNRAGLGSCSSTPAFAETVPSEATSVSPEDEGSALTEEDAAQAGRDHLAAGQLTAADSDIAEGSINKQASINQELGQGGRTSYPPLEEAPHLDSAGIQSEALEPSTRWPNSPMRPRQQIRIRQADLEGSMHSYLNAVLAHVHCHSPGMGPVNELHALMQRVSAEDHSQGRAFRHPADLTMRNYAERVNQPTQKCTLGQWVARNQRSHPLFVDVPDRFKRSPIPSL